MAHFNVALVIEDDPITIFLHKKILSKHSIAEKIIIKNEGQAALDFISQGMQDGHTGPDLIIVDLNLPGMDGFEFIQKLNESNYKSTIAVITNSMIERDKLKIKALNIDHYIEKPLTIEKVNLLLSTVG